jgi:hypothetical protein
MPRFHRQHAWQPPLNPSEQEAHVDRRDVRDVGAAQIHLIQDQLACAPAAHQMPADRLHVELVPALHRPHPAPVPAIERRDLDEGRVHVVTGVRQAGLDRVPRAEQPDRLLWPRPALVEKEHVHVGHGSPASP